MITVTAPAKLNVTLRVGALAQDGYHPVDTVMATLPDIHDVVTVTRATVRSVTCPGVAEHDNLAWRALDAFEAHVGRACRVAVSIEKMIPTQAGLGGGSSDAAATLIATNRLLGFGLANGVLETIAAQVGADVAFFIRGGVQRASGRGELLSPAALDAPTWAVLARPPFGLSTSAVYSMFDRIPPRTASTLANDLWPAALAIAPGLGRVARALAAVGADRVVLCGSGSTVAGLVASEGAATRMFGALTEKAPHCWIGASRVGARLAPDHTSQ